MTTISTTDKLIFTKHLGVMVKAGIPLDEALLTLENDASSSSLKTIIHSLRTQIESGESLSSALTKYPKVFDGIYLSLVKVGEESGSLDDMLSFLSIELSKLYKLKKKIQGAMMYPTLVVSVMSIIGLGLSFFVLPKLVDFFAAFNQTLPLSTRILLAFASLMKYHGTQILIYILILGFVFFLLSLLKPVKKLLDRIVFHLPLVGNFIHISKVAELARDLSILISSGVPLVPGLTTLITSQTNSFVQANLESIQTGLTKGQQIGQTISSKNLVFFPSLFGKMVSVGEKTGKLDEMLMYLADYYESEIDNSSKNLTIMLEPILLVIVGLVVGFMAMAIIGPIYQITGSIGG